MMDELREGTSIVGGGGGEIVWKSMILNLYFDWM